MEFRVLGTIEARQDGRQVELGPVRQRSVLAALLADANRLVPVDQLIDRVWADNPPLRARDTLYSYLSRLRGVLAGGGLEIERLGGGYFPRVDPDAVDLHRFRRLVAEAREAEDDEAAAGLFERARELWRGEALADVGTPWADELRRDLRAEQWAAELDHADVCLRQGRHAELLPELTVRTREHPLDERLAGQVVLALYRCGRQADALDHYEQLRRRLVRELGADPSPPLRELHLRVLRGDPDLTAAPAGTLPGADAVPHHFPAAPPSFIGRADELAALTAASRPEADVSRVVQISALAGAGGVGKTWLVLHWAHAHRDRFPDGRLFADLHGFSSAGAPLDPSVVVRGFLGALGVVPSRIPPEPDAQVALYRKLVDGKRMLVVLDNAADAEQVVPLLPGSPACTTVVTSRRHLAPLITRYGARHLQLDILSHGEAHALLAERLGEPRIAAEPAAAEALISLCGRYPLALAIMSRHAHTRPHIPLAEFAAELRDLGLDALDHDDPTVSLPTVLSWSLRALTGEQRTLFALLGTAPGADIGLPAAAALAGSPPRRTAKVLSMLEEASLLTRRAGGRYAMHDLIRDYATATAERDLPLGERRAALDRVLDFYAHTAHAADHRVDPHRQAVRLAAPAPGVEPGSPSDDAEAMAWFDAEHANLLAAQRAAAGLGRHDVVWHLAWSLHTFQNRRGMLHDRLVVWQAALEATEHLSDPSVHIRAHRLIGDVFMYFRRHDEAVEHLGEAAALAAKHEDPTEEGLIHHGLSWVWQLRGDDRQALEHATRALAVFRTLDRPVWEARELNQVGWFAARTGDFETARSHCTAALALHRRHGESDGEADTLDSLGYIEHHTGHHAAAIDYYQRALTVYRERGNTFQVADTLSCLGLPHAALGHHDQARAAWQEALELFRQQGRTHDAERVRRELDALDGARSGLPSAH
ncbi:MULTISPECIES: BTAD domain-containing putative transcriptional regulator [unclassified Amycolatopsis]|uniref:AfsR/SARP family transcriptional regulator n=1 Tax=unclassified Amycolatopsis TaxID=2618356 RepID=UPI002875F6A7|nr:MULTISPECIES: BTAD domain-containing putative transcriptional regulator [unclassified Amycolatopsis]MDS0132567.1 tetratricopeptide repeat protein [Amycolatopsis sp. 505]MDS0142608.1 tetratricopeptide repeat protein [Amycolatopsis sp. CM201R]